MKYCQRNTRQFQCTEIQLRHGTHIQLTLGIHGSARQGVTTCANISRIYCKVPSTYSQAVQCSRWRYLAQCQHPCSAALPPHRGAGELPQSWLALYYSWSLTEKLTPIDVPAPPVFVYYIIWTQFAWICVTAIYACW